MGERGRRLGLLEAAGKLGLEFRVCLLGLFGLFGLRQIRVRFGLLGLGPFKGYWVGVVFGLRFG